MGFTDAWRSFREQVTGLLAQLGHGVCGTASSLLQTLEAVQRHRPDLTIIDAESTDSAMAIDTARHVYWNWGIHSLFIGAAFGGAFEDKTSGIRAVGYLRKPLAIEALRHTLDGVVNGIPKVSSPRSI